MIKALILKLMRCMGWLLLGLAGLLVILALMSWVGDTYFDNFFSKDACMDSGGAWDYQYERCVHATPENPNPPYQKAPDPLVE